jgi:hypothetical protein
VPALEALKSKYPCWTAYAAAKRSAIGDRQMFPVQTKSTCRTAPRFMHHAAVRSMKGRKSGTRVRNDETTLAGSGGMWSPVAVAPNFHTSVLGRPGRRAQGRHRPCWRRHDSGGTALLVKTCTVHPVHE